MSKIKDGHDLIIYLYNFIANYAAAYTSFGRLVIKEELIKNHEIFWMTKLITLFLKCTERERPTFTDFR